MNYKSTNCHIRRMYFFIFLVLTTFYSPSYAQLTKHMGIPDASFSDIFFFDKQTGWAIGWNGLVVATKDGGKTWTQQGTPTDRLLKEVTFADKNNGYIVTWQGKLLTTSNGGTHWEINDRIIASKVFFVDSNTGWIAGNDNERGIGIFKTTDAGETFEKRSLPKTPGTVTALFFADKNNGWMALWDGIDNFSVSKFFKTLDGGNTWQPLEGFPISGQVYELIKVTENTLWATIGWGWATRAAISHDSGNTWNVIYSSSGNIRDIAPLMANSGWILTNHDGTAKIHYTQNAGIALQEIHSLNNVILYSIFGFSNDEFWAVGNKGNILHYNNGAVTMVNEAAPIPQDISLLQNYPNPFNPSTSIRFSMTAPDKVTIKIFNVLGREVLTLTSDEYSTGEHEVLWNGGDRFGNLVSSGVYFYQLTTGNHIETKKMLLIK